jgi:hypothetical protein
MNKSHRKTLDAIFATSVRSDFEWKDTGSRVRIALKGVRAVFHRPHPKKETDKGAVKSVRRFLKETGVI